MVAHLLKEKFSGNALAVTPYNYKINMQFTHCEIYYSIILPWISNDYFRYTYITLKQIAFPYNNIYNGIHD